jgi:hypothetical protein
MPFRKVQTIFSQSCGIDGRPSNALDGSWGNSFRTSGLILFSAVMLLQFPGLSGMGEKGGLLFYKGLF